MRRCVMKPAKDYIKHLRPLKAFGTEYLHKESVLNAIERAQIDAYNQALERLCDGDAVQLEYDNNGSVFVDKQSILKLKK